MRLTHEELDALRHEDRIAGGIALYDASHLMPRGRHRRKTRRPRGQRIDAVFVHHSGALGRPGLAGAMASARFVVERRGFPGPGYHLWLPREPLLDDAGRLVVLRLVPDATRAWHTGARANDRGIGVCLQGHTGRRPISPSQVELLEGLLPWASEHYGLPWAELPSWLGWHAIGHRWGGRRKPACPGRSTETWLRGYLDRASPAVAA